MLKKVHYLLYVTMVVLILGCIISYTISVSLGHVYWWFPFISDTGAEAPESGIFGFTLNISSVLLLISMYIRYCQVKCVKEKYVDIRLSPYWNRAAIFFGVMSCFGLNMVANFSELNMGVTHLSGAFICFTCATIYFMIQTKVSYHFINHNSDFAISKTLFIFRFLDCVAMTAFYFSTLYFGKLAIVEFTGYKINHWTPEDGGFTYRLISTFSEWLTAICFMFYITSFAKEFRKIECDNFAVRIKL